MRFWIAMTLAVLVATGCQGSRWAKRDADYRQKYPRHTNNVAKTLKQAVDARHVRGKGGYYVAGAGRDNPIAGGTELGIFRYGEPWLEGRAGLAALVHETGDYPLSGGAIASGRLQVPARFAPFVGAGIYGGWAGLESAENDGYDNDDDGFIDERGEDDHAFAVAIFPEVGAHFWVNHRVRVTTSLTYYLTNQGRDDDFLFYSVGFSFFPREYEDQTACPRIEDPSLVLDEFIATPPEPLPPGTNVSPYAELEVSRRQDSPAFNGPPFIYPTTDPTDAGSLLTRPTDAPKAFQPEIAIPFESLLDVRGFDEDDPHTVDEVTRSARSAERDEQP